MEQFVDRDVELDQLTDCYESETADFVVIYGRRRLGKSELVRQSIADRDDAVYYQAVESTAQNQLEQFVDTATAQFPALQNVRRDWEALLETLGEEDAIVVIDEFPFLIEEDESLPSRIQRVWDMELQETGMTLVLIGSSISVMEDKVLSGSAPLYGRRTATIDLKPLDVADARQFFPEYNPEMSAAKAAVDDGTPVADVCCGLQETAFAMLTEVSERALSLTGRDELVLGGGVGQNARLREMLGEMCDQRGADFFAPEARFLRDNAGMIALLGAKMYAAGDTLALADSRVDADFRPDEVPVTWRDAEPAPAAAARGDRDCQGAEATVTIEGATAVKTRNPRSYRHPALDERLRRERTREEARLLADARRAGVPTPLVRDVDLRAATLRLQAVGDCDLREALSEAAVRAVGRQLAAMHRAGFVHGDPTTRNVRVAPDAPDGTVWIDFGLGYYSRDPEDHAMDLHVLAGSLAGTADEAAALMAAAEDAYSQAGDPAVLDRLREIEDRGRYR